MATITLEVPEELLPLLETIGDRLALVLEMGASRLERIFQLGNLRRRGAAVVLAEQAQQRAGEVRRLVGRRDWLRGSQLLFGHHLAAAPAVHGRVEAGHPARGQERVPAAGAGAPDADLAVDIGK